MEKASSNREERFIQRHIVALTEVGGMPFAEAKVRIMSGDRKAVIAAQRAMGSMRLAHVPGGTPVVFGGSIYRVMRKGKYLALQRLGKGAAPKGTVLVPRNSYVIPMTYEDAVEWLFGKDPVEA